MKPFLVIYGLLAIPTLHAQIKQITESVSPWMVAVFYDQDYTLEQLHLPSLNEDRNYTMGLGIMVADQRLKKSWLYAPHYLLNNIFNKRFLNDKQNRNTENRTAIMIGNGSFTPDYLPEYNIIANDRPYGSITYLQTITSFVDNSNYTQSISTFSAGILGSNVSKAIQTKIHKMMNENDTKNPRTPRGWHNQISQGGELALNYTCEKEMLLTKKAISEEKQTSTGGIEIKHGYGYSIGYYTSAHYGLNFRLGQKDPRNWTYRVNPLASSNKKVDTSVNYYERKKQWEVYLFGSIRPNFILYNALLNGAFRKSAHTISFQDTRHLVLEMDGGGAVSVPFPKRVAVELKLRISSRSPEFKLPGRMARFHYWGGIDLVISQS